VVDEGGGQGQAGGRWNRGFDHRPCLCCTLVLAVGVLENLCGPRAMGLAFIRDEGLPPLCVCMDKVFAELPAASDWLYVNVLRLGVLRIPLRLFIRTRPCCTCPACPSSSLCQTWRAGGGGHSRRFSSRPSSRARQPTGPGLTPRPDRPSPSPSIRLPLQPPPPLPKARPSWIHSPKPSTPSSPQTM